MVWLSLPGSRAAPGTAATAGAAHVPWNMWSLLGALVALPHLPGCLQGQGRCHSGGWESACAVDLISDKLVISWPRRTAPAILSHLSICCFYFKFREGLVFPKAYLLFLTRLNGLITKNLPPAASLAPLTSHFILLPGPVAFSTPVTDSTGNKVLSAPLKGRRV